MNAERQGFLNAILARLEDDLPRLIFADWLGEHGDSEWAEFIRVQCRLAVLEREEPLNWETFEADCAAWPAAEHAALRRRERALLGVALGSLPPWWPRQPGGRPGWAPEFRRGFVEGITCSWEDWLRHHEAIRAATPLRKVTLTPPPGVATGVARDESGFVGLRFADRFPGIEFETPQAPDVGALVETAIRELGPLRALDAAEDLQRMPALGVLLRKGRVRRADVFNGPGWLSFTSNYMIADEEIHYNTAQDVVALIGMRRHRALVDLLAAIDRHFTEAHPGADLPAWRMAILSRGWLRETVVSWAEGRQTVVNIGATARFEPAPLTAG